MFLPKPRIIEISGIKTPIDPDFRIMCEYSGAVMKKSPEKLSEIAARFFFAGTPDVGNELLAEAMNDFYVSGLAPIGEKKDSSPACGAPVPSFDFEEDEGYFYADFLARYHIDLNTAKLHWLDFCALFRGLPDECRLKRIIGIRSQDLGDIKSSAEKARIRRLKRIFALKKYSKPRFSSVEERDRAVREDILRRCGEAEKRMEGGV